jgi:hypothetical protein
MKSKAIPHLPFSVLIPGGCSGTKNLPEGELLYTELKLKLKERQRTKRNEKQ